MEGVVAPEGIAANQLGQAICLMRRSGPHRAHFHQLDGHASIGQLVGALAASQSATDDGDWIQHCVGDYKSASMPLARPAIL